MTLRSSDLTLTWTRAVAVFEKGQIVGGSHSRRVEMTVPGASTIISGVCNVSVQPTHTRRGVMTQMMKHQLNDFHDRGEPVSALFSTESIIYGRFGPWYRLPVRTVVY
ncbi:MAG: hypothetical protein CM1200mP22_15280 [Dehalococcoidia bacterium]|nr:MAG: hypothetical protein CM1200mP22_15280 [Dehalococcoidia bacterium]